MPAAKLRRESGPQIFGTLAEALAYERAENVGRKKDANRPKTYEVVVPAMAEQRWYTVARNPVDAVHTVAEEKAGIRAYRRDMESAIHLVEFMSADDLDALEQAIRKARGKV